MTHYFLIFKSVKIFTAEVHYDRPVLNWDCVSDIDLYSGMFSVFKFVCLMAIMQKLQDLQFHETWWNFSSYNEDLDHFPSGLSFLLY